MERALEMLRVEGLHFAVAWKPFQLNPDMPTEGADRAAYRAAKFGSRERAAELDVQVAQAARSVGLGFRPDLMTRTPNTLDAHRLIWLAERGGVQDQVVEAVSAAHFTQGRDIGEAEVLAACGAEAGLDRGEVMEFLASDQAVAEIRAADRAARDAGVRGVPSFFVDGYGLFSGAVPAERMAEALRRGQAILRQRAA